MSISILLQSHWKERIVVSNITIYEVAKAAGVSASTVSRVINNKLGVNNETRKRVREYLAKFHYSPNEAARGLVNQSTRMIGILLSDLRTTHHTDGVFLIQHELEELGYSCIIMSTGREDADRVRYIRQLNQRRVEGAVLIGSAFETEAVRDAIAEYLPNIPVIITNGYLDLPNVYGIIADERNGIVDCVKLLAEKGRRNLAFLYDYETPSNRLKIEGFREGVRRYCGNKEKPRVISAGTDFQAVHEATVRMMQAEPAIDGIICAEDPIAAAALRALRDCDRSVPTDVGVIGVNNSSFAKICTPSLTSLDNMLLDLSVTAARNLTEVLRGRHVVKKMMIYSHVVEREST